ncbi:hypothetical protein GTR00_10880 [Kineococcus sp. T90]|nr:hypothetical protein [Kineococcus indalonis]
MALAAGGCGTPAGGEVRHIEASEVPRGLLEAPAHAPEADPGATGSALGPQVYFVDTEQVLVPVPLGADASGPAGPEALLAALLRRLSTGPGTGERADGLASALGPEVGLEVESLLDGTARIAVSGLGDNLAADRQPLAVGQVVLTATSAPGVRAVRLVRDEEVLEVPLPGGERTAAPLTLQDYAPLLRPAGAT